MDGCKMAGKVEINQMNSGTLNDLQIDCALEHMC